jgi:hypothetical protein
VTGFDEADMRARIAELERLDELAAEAERQAAAERTAALAEIYEQPALGSWRNRGDGPARRAERLARSLRHAERAISRLTTETTLTTEPGPPGHV